MLGLIYINCTIVGESIGLEANLCVCMCVGGGVRRERRERGSAAAAAAAGSPVDTSEGEVGTERFSRGGTEQED